MSPPAASISNTDMVGARPGRVICHMRFILPAPSTYAASYRFGSMPPMAPRYTMVDHPRFFHIRVNIRIGQAILGIPRNMMGSLVIPSAIRRLFTTPCMDKN